MWDKTEKGTFIILSMKYINKSQTGSIIFFFTSQSQRSFSNIFESRLKNALFFFWNYNTTVIMKKKIFSFRYQWLMIFLHSYFFLSLSSFNNWPKNVKNIFKLLISSSKAILVQKWMNILLKFKLSARHAKDNRS